MVRNESIEGFLNRLSSSAPTPGGGGAGALSGAVGCALGRMVCALTLGRKKYAAVQEEMASLEERFGLIQEEFLQLADQDETVFSAFMEALKLPKDTEEEKMIRKKAVDAALLSATEVPLSVMEKAVAALREVVSAAQKGNKNAVSDAGAASHMLLSALETGGENVRINLASMKDEEQRHFYENRMEALLQEGSGLSSEIVEIVRSRVEGS